MLTPGSILVPTANLMLQIRTEHAPAREPPSDFSFWHIKSQSPEFTVGIDAKRTFVDKRSRPNL